MLFFFPDKRPLRVNTDCQAIQVIVLHTPRWALQPSGSRTGQDVVAAGEAEEDICSVLHSPTVVGCSRA